ncbi:RES family NAD+ phosphorylase [Rhizobium sp. RU36D]|uniref:RES family NAD+ phosphorylase n=1 Tax=Rhizobium sp. RU36D TaxID=1907415 RepID=UPI0009D7FAC7|nr:RES family NAD+ phosphorylase [Rhizobium sp. RU36D]SMD00410.1 RES domain-containing protein [Rhizobium sp. RU36D]
MQLDGDDEVKRVCFRCIGNAYLSARVQREGEIAACSYCGGSDDQSFTIDEMADCVALAFEQHYARTPSEPNSMQYAMQNDWESDYSWDREGEPVDDAIADAASVDRAIAMDIREVLADRFGDWDASMAGEETEFDGESMYERKSVGSGRWTREWNEFERSLKTEARFFSRSAMSHLAELFEGMDDLKTRNKTTVLVEAGPGFPIASLYRARSFPRYSDIHGALARPDLHLGPPPASVARAGRMNAHGISVFYGATDPLIALAEVRPPVGCSVAIARFEIAKSVTLLDLTSLSDAMMNGSIFDPTFLDRLQRAEFLRRIGDRITVPVMPDDENLGYLATQAIADFLATIDQPDIDGILFPSVQAKGDARNVVLFHKSSRVRPMDIPAGTKIDVNDGFSTEDGWETDYSVYERTPRVPPAPPNPASSAPWFQQAFDIFDPDPREFTLNVDAQSLEVHVVEAVSYQTEKNRVRRQRFQDSDPPF